MGISENVDLAVLDRDLSQLDGPDDEDLRLIELADLGLLDEDDVLLRALDLPHTIHPPKLHVSTEPWWPERACKVGFHETDEAKRNMAALFHPTRNDSPWVVAAAKSICAVCPVREECLDYALEANETVGIWGGLGAKERRPLARRRRIEMSQLSVVGER